MSGPLDISILFGHVFHSRSETASNSFSYPIFNIYFSIDELERLKSVFALKFKRLLSLTPNDYLLNQGSDLKTEIELFVQTEFQFARGENYDRVCLQTIPKMFGYVFNPVSFWYFFKGQNLNAVLCEVRNTFGEKHFYWLDKNSVHDDAPGPHSSIHNDSNPNFQSPNVGIGRQWLSARKEFHVSPFFPIDGQYKFKFDVSEHRLEAHIQFVSADGQKRLITWIKGEFRKLELVSLLQLTVKYGWMTPLVVGRIHYQALKLFFKKVKFFSKPNLPENKVTHGARS